MLPSSNNRFTRYGLILFFLVVIGYGLFEAKGLLIGPVIDLSTEETRSATQMVKIQGHADRISSLTMNGADISVTENGDFSEPYVLANGINTIVLQAKDKYGNETTKTLKIVYTPQGAGTNTSPQMGTSSP